MTTLETLQIIWFFIIGFFFTGYTVLDGFDLGIGSSLPFLATNEKDTAKLLSAIGPIWDGNEVWIITGGASLFAAFPHVYATVFSGFYLALMLLLFAMIFRAVSIEFWFLHEKMRTVWQWTFVVSSILITLLLAVALGNVIVGIPIDYNTNYAGTFFTLLRPYPLIIGFLGLIATIVHGCSFAMLKTEGDTNSKARSVAASAWIFYIIMIIAATIASFIYMPESMQQWKTWIIVALVIACLVAYRLLLNKSRERILFLLSSLCIVGLWSIAGVQLFPNLVHASEGFNMTIFNSSSSETTLRVMLVIACIGIPLVIGYTGYVYRIFKGKVA